MKNNKSHFRINHQISARELRVIGSDGKQIGLMSREEALQKASELELDLIEIAPMAKPPVAKIEDFGKFKYQEEKKLKKSKKGSKGGDIKEIRFSPFIGDHDFNTRVERIREFLDENNKVRIVVKFGGRQMGSKEFGYNVVKRIIQIFESRIVIDMEPKFIGRHLTAVISPTNKKKTDDKVEGTTPSNETTSS